VLKSFSNKQTSLVPLLFWSSFLSLWPQPSWLSLFLHLSVKHLGAFAPNCSSTTQINPYHLTTPSQMNPLQERAPTIDYLVFRSVLSPAPGDLWRVPAYGRWEGRSSWSVSLASQATDRQTLLAINLQRHPSPIYPWIKSMIRLLPPPRPHRHRHQTTCSQPASQPQTASPVPGRPKLGLFPVKPDRTEQSSKIDYQSVVVLSK
jgi:hypothetical protein